MDEIGKDAFEILSKWHNEEEIVAQNDLESSLYETLKRRGYLVHSEEEEVLAKNKILEFLRKNDTKDRENRKHMTFVMTYDCNFRCFYCFEGEDKAKRAVMTPSLIDSALTLAGGNLESIELFGGEPLLPKTRYAFEYLIEKMPDVFYGITTNGYYLEDFFDLIVKIKTYKIIVTLDGEEEVHDGRRYLANGKPTYQKIMRGVRKCLENGITITIRMNVDDSNFANSTSLETTLLDEFSRYKNLIRFDKTPMLEMNDLDSFDLVAKMYESMVSYTPEERMQKNGLITNMSPIINSITASAPMRPLYNFCYAHENKLAVDPYGDIYTCLLTVGKPRGSAGKYHPFIELKENSIYNRNIDKIKECTECIYSLLCGGGCALRIQDPNDMFKPACSSIKNQIHNLLPKLYKIAQNAELQK